MKRVVYFLSLASACEQQWSDFLERYPERFPASELEQRKVNFCANLHEIETYADPGVEHSHLSPLAAHSEEEFGALLGFVPGLHSVQEEKVEELVESARPDFPETFDWTSRPGFVSAVKNQGHCGSCWAFSTIANIETAYVVQGNGTLTTLSEQQLVDCSVSDRGCRGGLPSVALQELAENISVASEAAYPYNGSSAQCSNVPGIVTIHGVRQLPRVINAIKAGLVQYGALSAAVEASSFKVYHRGVISSRHCSNAPNHAVNLVGYGLAGVRYWKVRNSWGPEWGEQGYFRIEEHACAIEKEVVTATFEHFPSNDLCNKECDHCIKNKLRWLPPTVLSPFRWASMCKYCPRQFREQPDTPKMFCRELCLCTDRVS